jgi:hypothetical protein
MLPAALIVTKRFVTIIVYDAAYTAVCAIQEGKDAKAIMRELQPYLERRFARRRARWIASESK